MSDIAHPSDDLALLERAVAEAAETVMGFYQRDPKSWKKNDVSPVSEADLAADGILHRVLTAERPDYGWLSEETEDNPARLDRHSIWVVDPIDGTNAFLQGKPEFTVCAALVRGGIAVAGAVTNPVKQQRFTAIRGQGAWLNGERLTLDNDPPLSEARILSRRNVLKADRWRDGVPDVPHGYVGSLAYQLCLVAKGKWNAAISVNRLHEWDIAAAGLILQEAGGLVTDQHGDPMTYNRETPRIDGMICASPSLHSEIVQALIPKG